MLTMPRDDGPRAFLDVSRSLTGRTWHGPDADTLRRAEALVQRTGLPDALARVLATRRIAPDAAEAFLSPTLRDLLPDPSGLRDMDAAAARLSDAAARGERIAIFADYDVDGAASAALLVAWLRPLGRTATVYVPDRIDEGYGPNPEAMARLAADHDLIVCVDCGTLSHEAIAAASAADVVVLDHHQGGETLPPALAVVNPNRQDEDRTLGHLCAAAVVFLALVAANRIRRDAGQPCSDLMELLDLVALATVADVAPLTGVNRAFVRQGLRVMARRERPGLTALADLARLGVAPSSHHLGFVLGPRINAGGRIGAADLGARLLSTACPSEAAALAERLDTLNTERREVEAAVRAAAMDQAEARGTDGPLVWAAGAGWHPGVVGIVAARLKEAFGRPAVVIGLEDGVGKGSARSVAGVDLGAAIQRVAGEGLLMKGGGHAMAAGLTVAEGALEPAMSRLGALLARQGAGLCAPESLALDGLVRCSGADIDLIEAVESAGPFGAGAPAPRFALADCQIRDARRMGDSHLRLRVADGTGPTLSVLAFGAFDGPLGPALVDHAGRSVHLAGRLEVNHWQGRSTPQLRLEDAAFP